MYIRAHRCTFNSDGCWFQLSRYLRQNNQETRHAMCSLILCEQKLGLSRVLKPRRHKGGWGGGESK